MLNEPAVASIAHMKSNFGSADEYLLYQKSLLKKELKTFIRKHVESAIENHKGKEEAWHTVVDR